MEHPTARPADSTAVASSRTQGADTHAHSRSITSYALLGALGLALALVGAAAATKLLLFLISMGNLGFVIYIPAVAIAAWYRGLIAGFVATGLAVVVALLVFEYVTNASMVASSRGAAPRSDRPVHATGS